MTISILKVKDSMYLTFKTLNPQNAKVFRLMKEDTVAVSLKVLFLSAYLVWNTFINYIHVTINEI